MATNQDASTTLNPGSGGDTMDESAPVRADATVKKRARIVLTGDASEYAVLDLVRRADGSYALPIDDADLLSVLQDINSQLATIKGYLAKLSGSL
jgi:Golgi nucleoside diphosphatase